MAVFTGGRGRQVFDGTADMDRMFGLGGSDILRGLGGDDELDGGEDNDTLDGGVGADRLSGGTGDDLYYVDQAGDLVIEEADAGRDTVFASFDHALAANVENLRLMGAARIGTGNTLANRITGTAGDDSLFGLDGDDVLLGANGIDRLEGGDGDDIMNGGLELDTLIGGAGDDIYYLDSPAANRTDFVIETADSGYDTVILTSNRQGFDFLLPDNVERLVLTDTASRAFGNALDNIIRGGDRSDIIYGGGGDDVIYGGVGLNTLYGNDGDDVLFAGTGAQSGLYGGAGHDRFVISHNRSQIADFSRAEGDLIDLRLVDANRRAPGDDQFTFIGTEPFHGIAGELRYEVRTNGVILFGDTNGDGDDDFTMNVGGTTMIIAADFIL